MRDTTLIEAEYIIPIRPANCVLEQHCVVIQEGRIEALMPRNLARAAFDGATEVVLDRHVLIPGLINMHTHSPMVLFRGFADDKDMQSWLRDDIWPLESRFVDAGFVADGTRLAIAEMLRSGTTCFNDMYFFPDSVAEAARSSGMRACIGLPIIEMATAWAANVEACFERGMALVQHFGDDPLIGFSLAPHAPYTVGDDTLDRIAALALEYALPVHMHLLETAWEMENSMFQYGMSPLQRLDRRGLLNDRLLAVHVTQANQAGIQLLAERAVNVIHCPESNLKLASGICPLGSLRQAGVNVAIGTDGAASNNDLDLLGEARTAALLAKGVSCDASSPNAFDLLEMLTINAASALGLAQVTGSIEAGKRADLAALNLHHVRTQPVHHVISSLLYSAASSQFTDVWVDGRRLLMDGVLQTVDEEGLMDRAAEWRDRLKAAAGTGQAGHSVA